MIRALTLWQPTASVLIYRPDLKPYETRSWAPPRHIIGQRIAIHAGKRFDDDAPDLPDGIPQPLPQGAILAKVTLADVFRVVAYDSNYRMTAAAEAVSITKVGHRVIQQEGDWSNMAVGRYLWHITEIEPYDPPLTWRGAQGLWHTSLKP